MIPVRRGCSLLLLVGCASQLDTGVVGQGSTTGEDDPTGPTSTPPPTASTTVPPGTTDVVTTGPGDSTGIDGATSTTGEPPSSTGTGGDTEGAIGNPCGAEQAICTIVELDGSPAGSCGQTLDLKGIVQDNGDGTYTLEDCGDCKLCGGPQYSIEFVAPGMWAPDGLPLCSHIAIDFAPMDSTPWACSFTGVTVWADDGLYEESAPMYVGTSIVIDPPSGVAGLDVDRENIEPEPCAEMDCCLMEPGKYRLTFDGAGLADPLALEEHDEAMDVDMFSRTYDVYIERAHAHKECDKIPHFDWVMRR